MFDTEFNRESSALPYLLSANNGIIPAGVFSCESIAVSAECIVNLLSSVSDMNIMAAAQNNLLRSLEGQKILYAKDYLNYLLDLSLSVKEFSSL